MNFSSFVAQQWARYERLTDREQLLVICSLVVFGLLIFVYGVWNPIHTARDKMKQGFKNELALSAEIAAFSGRKVASNTSAITSQDQSLLAIVNETTGQLGMNLKRVEPKNDESLRVWVDDVAFNQLLVWLETLQTKHGVSVSTVSIDKTQLPGSVNSALVLAR